MLISDFVIVECEIDGGDVFLTSMVNGPSTESSSHIHLFLVLEYIAPIFCTVFWWGCGFPGVSLLRR